MFNYTTLLGKLCNDPQTASLGISKPISSCVSRKAVVIKSTSVSSIIPPGKLILGKKNSNKANLILKNQEFFCATVYEDIGTD